MNTMLLILQKYAINKVFKDHVIFVVNDCGDTSILIIIVITLVLAWYYAK